MQNVSQESRTENQKVDKLNVHHDIGNLQSTPHSTSNSSPAKSETETYSEHRRYISDSSESEEDSVSEVESFMIDQEFEEDHQVEAAKFLLNSDEDRGVDPETQARLEALLQAAGIGQLAAKDGKHLGDPEVLRRLTSSVSCALDEAAAALTRMRSDNPRTQPEKTSLVEACTDGDVGTVRKLLTEGRSVHETSEEGESLLSLACSAGYFELAQVLLAMHANVEDRGIKGECTPLMEAASAGHLDIVRLLVSHGADVNAQSTSGNTPLMYGCAGGHTEVVKFLLENGANVEDHNENGHTPLMEAASAGHVGLAKILLIHGAGINTHSNEFKESALTLACYKGHLDMVRFLLEAGADQEHKTDEMHTALMEASMDGHVEVARLLLDSGAQVNMPTDSFESPLTLAACGGHVDLAMLLIERGANIEEVNDEGYTPLMEAAREGHEEMVHLLLGQGANINAQTDETQETALTLACCGGFTEVTDILLKGGADIELGASTPLMEAAQEGHLDLVKFLLESGANVHAQTQTGDTALTYACENGHTDVADLLLQYGADLEHESEGGRTPLMKACRAGHMCTVQFLISKGANVRRQTTNNDHTPLSLACAGGHLSVVELLLSHNADPNHKLKDNSTMLIEASKGGHTNVVQLLLDYPHSMQPIVLNQHQQSATSATNITMLPGQVTNQESPLPPAESSNLASQPVNLLQPSSTVLQDVPEVVRIINQEDNNSSTDNKQKVTPTRVVDQHSKNPSRKSLLPKSRSTGAIFDGNLTSAEAQQVRTQPLKDFEEEVFSDSAAIDFLNKDDPNSTLIDFIKNRKKYNIMSSSSDEGTQKQQILEELHMVERELHGKQQPVIQYTIPQEQCTSSKSNTPTHMLNIDVAMHQQQGLTSMPNTMFPGNLQVHNTYYTGGTTCIQPPALKLAVSGDAGSFATSQSQSAFYFTPLPSSVAVTLSTATTNITAQPIKFQSVTSQVDIVQGQPYPNTLEESMIASLTAQADLSTQTDLSRVEYFTVPSGTQVPVHALYPYETYLAAAGVPTKEQSGAIYQAGFQAGINLMQQQLACPNASTNETLTTTTANPATVVVPGTSCQQYITQQPICTPVQTFCSHLGSTGSIQTALPCQVPCSQNQQVLHHQQQTLQVQAATQTFQTNSTVNNDQKKISKMSTEIIKCKKGRVQRHHNQSQGTNFPPSQPYQIDQNSAITQYSGANQHCTTTAITPPCMDVDSETESNHDTALTLACAGGHEELVELLISRGADIEHRDKKGFTPLILAATAGHEKVVDILLNRSADIEAQSERTKDTPLSLACSGGRYEVVELLLNRNANKEHRNVSDYTPLSLAASGGYVNIIKLLLSHGAEINSRTGSKLGISPLMLAAMNGHTAAVKLLLDMGSDINAQIETNRNTALTLACFQGRHEVVSLLLDRKANVEHRAKTGLTPLMEAASGGYVEVGRVLLDKGADVNATPVPSSRDTALTIAADKGHVRFVELLLCRGAQVEVKNKKGNSPLWLAANGGHLPVVELLYNVNADIDSQDNRKVSCLMAAFRKGHIKVVKWMVHHVNQFPSDQEMVRYISTVNDKELLEKCQECVRLIRAAKETQAARANKNASILLEELDMEKTREESKRLAAARRRERKKKKKLEKKEERRKLLEENKKNENYDEKLKKKCFDGRYDEEATQEAIVPSMRNCDTVDKEEGDSGIDANSQGSCSSNDIKSKEKRKDKKKKKTNNNSSSSKSESRISITDASTSKVRDVEDSTEKSTKNVDKMVKANNNIKRVLVFETTKSPAERDDFEATGNETYVSSSKSKQKKNDVETIPYQYSKLNTSTSPKQINKRDEGWKEVVRKSSVQTVGIFDSGVKKVSVPLNAISRVIGRGGSNINAIRGATGAHIEVEKQSKGQGERIITIKGSQDATKQAHSLIIALIKDPDVDILQMLPRTNKTSTTTTTLWDKTQIGTKKNAGKVLAVSQPANIITTTHQQKVIQTSSIASLSKTSVSSVKTRGTISVVTSRMTAPRMVSQAEKNDQSISTFKMPVSTCLTNARAGKVVTTISNQTFAAKLTETSTNQLSVTISHDSAGNKSKTSLHLPPQSQSHILSPQAGTHNIVSTETSPNKNTKPTTSNSSIQHFISPGKAPVFVGSSNSTPHQMSLSETITNQTSSMKVPLSSEEFNPTNTTPPVYSLFYSSDQPMWARESESQKPINFAAVTGGSNSQVIVQPKFIEQDPLPKVDASKAPGYKKGGSSCSPVSSKTSSNSTTPPNIPNNVGLQPYPETSKGQFVPPIGTNVPPPASQSNPDFYADYFTPQNMSNIGALNINTNDSHLMEPSYLPANAIQNLNFSQSQQINIPQVSMSQLNPKAPDFSSTVYNPISNKPSPQLYNGFPINSQNMYISKSGLDNYHSPAMQSSQNRWALMQLQQPFTQQQTELISGMAGMTIHNLARATGGDILENGDDLRVVNVNNSPNSPNLPPPKELHHNDNSYMEDRKPQPIGTERGKKNFNANADPNWMFSNDKPNRWLNLSTDNFYPDEMQQLDFSRTIPIDNLHNYTNGPTFYNQTSMGGMRHHEVISVDQMKMDIPWDGSSSSVTDIQDKSHGWTTKWNQ